MNNTHSPSDAKIIHNILLGDTNLFGILFDRYAKKVFGYLWHFSRNREDCEDFLQDTFYKAYINLKYCRDREKFSSWLFAIAHNVAVSNARKLGLYRVRELPEEYAANDIPSSEDINMELVRQEDAGGVRRAIDEMPVRYKEVTVLFYFNELSLRRISEILKVPINTVKTRLHRGRTYLAKRLKELQREERMELLLARSESR